MPTSSSLLVFALLALAIATACALHMQFARHSVRRARAIYAVTAAVALAAIGAVAIS
jgi:hypothetical protein